MKKKKAAKRKIDRLPRVRLTEGGPVTIAEMVAGINAICRPASDMLAWIDRHIERWENASKGAWTPSRVDKCNTALLVLRSARGYMLGEAETPLPSEYDPSKWTAQAGRQA